MWIAEATFSLGVKEEQTQLQFSPMNLFLVPCYVDWRWVMGTRVIGTRWPLFNQPSGMSSNSSSHCCSGLLPLLWVSVQILSFQAETLWWLILCVKSTQEPRYLAKYQSRGHCEGILGYIEISRLSTADCPPYSGWVEGLNRETLKSSKEGGILPTDCNADFSLSLPYRSPTCQSPSPPSSKPILKNGNTHTHIPCWSVSLENPN